MSTKELSNPEGRVSTQLNSRTVDQLKEMLDSRGLEYSASAKKADLVKLLAAHLSLNPTHVTVRANNPYHNGNIVHGVGADWKRKEERTIPLASWRQIRRDATGDDDFTVVSREVILGD